MPRDFTDLRMIMGKIYTYALYSRERFIKEGIVPRERTYNTLIRMIRDMYRSDIDENSPFRENRDGMGRYKCYQLTRNYFTGETDIVTAVFGLFPLKDEQIRDYFFCLAFAYSNKNKGFRTKQAASKMEEIGSDASDKEPTISRCLRRLFHAGYLKKENSLYTIPDTLEKLDDNELISLYYLASFFAGAGYPRVAGTFLRDTIACHIVYRGLHEPEQAFLFHENACSNIYDEPIVYQLLDCCRKHEEAWIETSGRHIQRVRITPVCLRCDTRLGRWYLFAKNNEKSYIMRVSKIRSVTPIGSKNKNISLRADTDIDNSYIAVKQKGGPFRIEAELFFKHRYTRDSFAREIIVGEIISEGQKEVYRAEVNDLTDIKPLLRAYGANLKIKSPTLRNELTQEYERILKKHGAIPRII